MALQTPPFFYAFLALAHSLSLRLSSDRLPLLGNLLKRTLELSDRVRRRKPSAEAQQNQVLFNLLERAADTEFGRHHGFGQILSHYRSRNPQALLAAFQAAVPMHDYQTMFRPWWQRALDGQADVCWPGKVKYFALSSGTSDASTKYIPVTADMTKHIRRVGVRQILTLTQYDLPPSLFTRGVLMLGGSTQLNKVGYRYEGDLSGIQARQIPRWFQPFYKPGKRIAAEQDWGHKLDEIVLKAKDWDIGYIVGVPAWLQLLMEKIIAHYKVKTIHDIWPNLAVFTHGGVAFEPYKKGFEALLGKPLVYLETYLASEGFVAYQARKGAKGMRLASDLGMFFEFVPFNDENFGPDGELKPGAQALGVGQVQEGVDYAILLTTCSGTWRYLLGDTVRFTDLAEAEIVITGRTKHFLSLCGEHLSVDNMNRAVELTSEEMGFTVREFTVAGVPHGTLFGHNWYLGVDGPAPDATAVMERLDHHLSILNDDYRIERRHALKDVQAKVLPSQAFYDFLRARGKEGGQNKFPRVVKGQILKDWEAFVAARG